MTLEHSKFKFVGKKPVGKVSVLAARMKRKIAESWYEGSEDSPEPWCRDITMPCGAVMTFPRFATHVIYNGEVWKIKIDDPSSEFVGSWYEEIVGQSPPKDTFKRYGDPEPWVVFWKMAYIRKWCETSAHALAEIGCQYVIRAWQLKETMVGQGNSLVYADLAIFGGKEV